MKRRNCLLAGLGVAVWPALAQTPEPFELARARATYLERITAIRRDGTLPIIDIESSYNPLNLDLPSFVKSMDRMGIAQMCASADQPGSLVKQGQYWSDHSLEAYRAYPGHFIPIGNGGNHPAWTESPDRFLDANEQHMLRDHYPMMGEFEFRHYPSPRQVQRSEMYRDVQTPIDGPQGHRLFSFAERTGLAFQIHYEIEDALLDPLESMLRQYPQAKVIWCHVDQIRYAARGGRYSPRMLADWMDKYPNLYVDTAFGSSRSVYKPSGEYHSRYWSRMGEWHDVMAARPYRFLAALDIGGDRTHQLQSWTQGLRNFLDTLPDAIRDIVAYKAAWKLLFNEEL